MSPSRIFIERPIATTLLVIALVLVGVVAYRQLAGVGVAAGGLPDDSDHDVLSGRKSGGDVVVGDGAAGAAVWADAGAEPDDVDEFVRQLADHAAVRSGSEHRCGRAGGAGGDQCGVEPTCRAICPIRRSTAR